MKNFRVQRQVGMISGQGEALSRIYKMVQGKAGRVWLYAVQDNPADNIYVGEVGKKGDGFGGCTMHFALEDGSIAVLVGPWHSNSEALLADTGVDLRDTHLTFGVISRKREHIHDETMMVDVLHQDDKPTLGKFNRIETLAQQMADERGETLAYYMQSTGGSVCAWVEPRER